MLTSTRSIFAIAMLGLAVAGCANSDGSDGLFSTASTAPAGATEAKVDPACVTLTSQIDGVKKEGIIEKVEKAAMKKYTMTPADLAKADQLNKLNANYQAKCGTVTPKATTAALSSTPPSPAAAKASAPTAAAKAPAAVASAAKAAAVPVAAAAPVAKTN
jgi:hypothetical protein